MRRRSSSPPAEDRPLSCNDVEIAWQCTEWTPAQYAAWRRFWTKLLQAALSPQAPLGQAGQTPAAPGQPRAPRTKES
jgi:hypothetical protein